MALSLVEHTPGSPVSEPGTEGLGALLAQATKWLSKAGTATVESVGDDTLAEAVATVARLESKAVSLRLALSAEADRRRVAEQTAETGTDA